jgi:ADP-heptose:LPS heptosyltransferase
MVKVLFITSSRIGDAILTSGVLAQVINNYPNCEVMIVASSLVIPLFLDCPHIKEQFVLTKKKGRSIHHWFELWKRVHNQKWDVVIDLRSVFFSWTIFAKKRFTLGYSKKREHRINELQRALSLKEPPEPKLWLSPFREERALNLLPPKRRYLALAPIANWVGKQWPLNNFAELAIRLTREGAILSNAKIIIFAAPHEMNALIPIKEPLQNYDVEIFSHSFDLLDIFSLLKRCDLFVGNDSGLMHMAAVANIPTLGLFGPSPEWRYAPWGAKSTFIRTPESFEELTEKEDFSFSSKKCYMDSLLLDDVIDAAERIWFKNQ